MNDDERLQELLQAERYDAQTTANFSTVVKALCITIIVLLGLLALLSCQSICPQDDPGYVCFNLTIPLA